MHLQAAERPQMHIGKQKKNTSSKGVFPNTEHMCTAAGQLQQVSRWLGTQLREAMAETAQERAALVLNNSNYIYLAFYDEFTILQTMLCTL